MRVAEAEAAAARRGLRAARAAKATAEQQRAELKCALGDTCGSTIAQLDDHVEAEAAAKEMALLR